MAKAKAIDIWTAKHVKSLAPDAASIPAAQKVLKKGGFGAVDPTADGRGWWVVCRGLTDTYQVSVRRDPDAAGEFLCECNCPSYKNPCKHALALLLYLVDHPELRTEADAPKAAASDFEALLKAVFANPDDDTARLVFADFLEENGESDRAALIRLQCEQARLKPQSKRFKELDAELKPLIAKAKKRINPLPEGLQCQLRRGFLRMSGDFTYLEIDALPARLVALFRDGWVATMSMDYYSVGGFAENSARPLLAQVGELDISTYPMDEDRMMELVADTADARNNGRLARVTLHKNSQKTFDQLLKADAGEDVTLGGHLPPERYYQELTPRRFDLMARTGRLDGARSLLLSGDLTDDDMTALLKADVSPLRELTLQGWALTRKGVAALADCPHFKKLASLEIDMSGLGSAGENAIPALAAATGLRNLDVLNLIDCDLTDADLRTLAKSNGFPKLTRLGLRQNSAVTARGAAAILASKSFPHLEHVDFDGADIDGNEQLPLLLAAPDRPRLELEFDSCVMTRHVSKGEVAVDIDNRGNWHLGLFADLASAKGANRVTHFVAPSLELCDDDVTDLAAGFDPKTLRSLNLTNNPLQNVGAAAVATEFAPFALRELSLPDCRIQSGGVAALANSDLFAGLHTLDLSRNNIGKAGVAALLKVDVPAGLKRLNLIECRLSADDKKKLKAKYGPRVTL